MSVLFIHFKASTQIGLGHAKRCLTLADHARTCGYRVSLLIDHEAESLLAGHIHPETEIILLASPKATDIKAVLETTSGPHWLCLDRYDVSSEFEAACKTPKTRLLVIDDLADRNHDCDILVDQTIGRDQTDYQGLVADTTVLLTGSHYALLPDDFKIGRDVPDSLEGFDLLISLGGSDPQNVSLKVLKCLPETEKIKQVHLLIGSGYRHLEDLQGEIATCPYKLHIHHNITDVAGLLRGCDLAIGAGGTSALERCRMSLPTIFIEIADNQKQVIHNMVEKGAGLFLGPPEKLSKETLGQAFFKISTPEAYDRHIKACQKICDAKGAGRVLEEMNRLGANP